MSLVAAAFLLALQPQATAPAQTPQQPEQIVVPMSAELSMSYSQAAEAMGTCWERQIARLPANTTPEAGGIAVEAQCETETTRLQLIAIQNINADPRTSPAQKSFAVLQVQQLFSVTDVTIAQLIRDQRAAAQAQQ